MPWHFTRFFLNVLIKYVIILKCEGNDLQEHCKPYFETQRINKRSYSRYRKSRQLQTKRRTVMKVRILNAGNVKGATKVHHETYKRVGGG